MLFFLTAVCPLACWLVSGVLVSGGPLPPLLADMEGFITFHTVLIKGEK